MKPDNNNNNLQLSDLECRLNIANDVLKFVCERAVPVNLLSCAMFLIKGALFPLGNAHNSKNNDSTNLLRIEGKDSHSSELESTIKQERISKLFQGIPQGLLGYAIARPDKDNLDDAIQNLDHQSIDHTKKLEYHLFSLFERTERTYYEKIEKLKEFRDKCVEAYEIADSPEKSLKFEADSTAELGVGNCYELSALAFYFLKNYHYPLEKNLIVYLMEGKNFDHVFIALAPCEITSKYMHEWPEDTVIVDLWLRCKFLLKNAIFYWRDMAFANNWCDLDSHPEFDTIMNPKADLEWHSFLSLFKAKPTDTYVTGPKPSVELAEEENRHCSSALGFF